MTLRRATGFLLATAALVATSPPPGDIGGCGQSARDLDPDAFFATRRATLCGRCEECDLPTETCDRLCEGDDAPMAFPEGCFPLVHDGTVCLRALLVASCDRVSDLSQERPAIPSECDFCPAGG